MKCCLKLAAVQGGKHHLALTALHSQADGEPGGRPADGSTARQADGVERTADGVERTADGVERTADGVERTAHCCSWSGAMPAECAVAWASTQNSTGGDDVKKGQCVKAACSITSGSHLK